MRMRPIVFDECPSGECTWLCEGFQRGQLRCEGLRRLSNNKIYVFICKYANAIQKVREGKSGNVGLWWT